MLRLSVREVLCNSAFKPRCNDPDKLLLQVILIPFIECLLQQNGGAVYSIVIEMLKISYC